MLRCPKCQKKLFRVEKSFQCENHHNYDIARQGYVNLMLGNQKVSGDSLEMVQARTFFLNQQFYQPLKDQLIQCLKKYSVQSLVDLGCGEGYYTSAFSLFVSECVGIDMSKEALKQASRHDKKTIYLLASIFHCPLQSQYFDAVTNIFAPLPEEEILRILKKEGYLIRVVPAPKHLWELKCELYEEVYENEVERASNQFKLIEEIQVEDVIQLNDTKSILALFQMTPYYWKTSQKAADHLKSLSHLTTKIAFSIQIYQRNA